MPLADACPACDAPVLLQRAGVGGHDAPPVLVPRCAACGVDYGFGRVDRGRPAPGGPGGVGTDRATEGTTAAGDELWLARRLATEHAAGAAALGGRAVPALNWFEVVRDLARLLATGRVAAPLARAVAGLGGPRVTPLGARPPGEPDPTATRSLETCRLAARRSWVEAAAWVLRGWPHRPIGVTDAAGLWSSDFLRDLDAPPPFFRNAVLTYRNARAARRDPHG